MPDDWTRALNDFGNCAEQLETVVEQIPEEALDRSLDEHSWTIRQIIHHLADASLIWSMFYRQVLGDSGGIFDLGWYWSKSQDEWGEIWRYSEREIKTSLDLYRACNLSMIKLLQSTDDPRMNQLVFNFPGEESQTMSVDGTVRWQSIHLKQHLKEINRILKD